MVRTYGTAMSLTAINHLPVLYRSVSLCPLGAPETHVLGLFVREVHDRERNNAPKCSTHAGCFLEYNWRSSTIVQEIARVLFTVVARCLRYNLRFE